MPTDVSTERGDRWRWVVLGLFSVFSASNAIQWITYSSIATATKEYFNLTTNELNMLSSVYMIVFVVGAYFTCTTFDRFGVRTGLLIGCGLNAIGSVLKVAPGLQKPSYTTLIIPQALNALAQLFVLSTPPLLAAQYFAPQQRTFVTAIAATANSLGNAIALFAPPLIVRTGSEDEFMLLFCLEMGLCVLITIACAFLLRRPSYQAPSQALLGELRSNHSMGQPAEEASSHHHHSRLAPREGESEMSAAEGRSCSSEDDHGEDADPMETIRSSRTAPATPHRHLRRAAPAASATEADDTMAVAKRLRGADGEVGDGLVDQTIMNPDFDRGSMSKLKKLTLWRRLRHNEHVITFIEVGNSIFQLFRRRDFLFLLGAFSISMGSVWTYASVLAQILEPFGVSATLAGIMGAVNVVVGTIVSYVVGLYVDRARRYKYPLLACLTGSVLCCLGLMIIMLKAPPNTSTMDGLCFFMYVLAGVFQNTAIPICFEFAMEISYPLSESVPGAMLMAGANLCSLIMLSVASAMLGNGTATAASCVHVLILITCVCFAGAILAIFPREQLHRHNAELEARQRRALEGEAAADEPTYLGGSQTALSGNHVPRDTAEVSRVLSRSKGNNGNEAVYPPRKKLDEDYDEELMMPVLDGRHLQHVTNRDELNGATPELHHEEDELDGRH